VAAAGVCLFIPDRRSDSFARTSLEPHGEISVSSVVE
jgi:hypothetical protein